MNDHVLITGGWGLVGSEIPEEAGQKPHRKELDLTEYDSLENFVWENHIEEVIHLAAKVGGVKANTDQILDFFNENLAINSNIVRVCQKRRIKKATFMLSTCVFPHNVQYPVDETMLHQGEPHPTNYGYAYAKRMLEVGSRCLRQQDGIQARCIIPCNIYGKNDNYNIQDGHVIPSLIHKMHIAKETGSGMVVWGSGAAEREFVYAPDIARAVTTIHNDPRDIPNLMIVSPSKAYTIREIVMIIADAMDYRGEILFDNTKPEGILRKPTRNDLFRKHYPDFEFTDIRKGIQETCDYMRSNYDHIRI